MEGDPVDTILRLCKLNIVDLLVLGALEKENLLKFYIGSIARNISRTAKCSVLLLTNPSEELQKYKKIIVNGVENPKTIHTINTALYLAKKIKVKDVTIVNEIHTPGLAMAIAEDSTAPEAKDYVLDQLALLADDLKSRKDGDPLTDAFYRQSARQIMHYLTNPEGNVPKDIDPAWGKGPRSRYPLPPGPPL